MHICVLFPQYLHITSLSRVCAKESIDHRPSVTFPSNVCSVYNAVSASVNQRGALHKLNAFI